MLAIEPAELTQSEQQELMHLENRMEQALTLATAASITLATCLKQIHDKRLYKTYGTFNDYCRERWQRGRQWGYQLIEAAQVLNTLSESENVRHGVHSLPENERQIRPLAQLAPEDQPIAWQRANKLAEQEGTEVTARHVQSAVSEINSEQAINERRYDGWPQDYPPEWSEQESSGQPPSRADTQRAQQFSVLVSSKTNEWYTPVHIIGLARRVLGGIDLDPASCAEANAVVQAESYCDQDIDGLSQPWHGRVWLNPPYGKTAGRSNQDIWAEKLITEYEAGRTDAALLLVKAALGYAWFERLWYAYPVCFVRERLYFTPGDDAEDGQAKAATAILYFGAEVARFKDVFRSIGRVILPEE